MIGGVLVCCSLRFQKFLTTILYFNTKTISSRMELSPKGEDVATRLRVFFGKENIER